MQQITYKYNKETSCLEEHPRKNRYRDFPCNEAGGQKLWDEYRASLKFIPTLHKEWPTRDLVEGRDFEIQNFCCRSNTRWSNCDRQCVSEGREIAVPLSPSRSQEEDEDQDYRDLYYSVYGAISAGEKMVQTVENIKFKYKLSKRI